MAVLIASPASAQQWFNIGDMNNTVKTLAFDSAGNLYAGGLFTKADGVLAQFIAKRDTSGTWSNIGDMTNGIAEVLAFDDADNLYAGGSFTAAGGVPAKYIAKMDTSGTWSNIGDMDGTVSALAFDSGNLYAGGEFANAGGVSAKYIAKMDTSGTWSNIGDMSNTVKALAFDNAGNLYAGGFFGHAGGVSAKYIAKRDTSGTWSNIGDMNHTVRALAFDSGNLYAGGEFTAAGGIPAKYIAKRDTSGTWSNIGDMDSTVMALAFDSAGNLYAGGFFTAAGGVAAQYIAKTDAGGTWSNIGDMDNAVMALACDSGNLYAGGHFTDTGRVAAKKIAKWGLPEINLSVGGTPIANGDTYYFGGKAVGSDTDAVFTLTYTGTADLIFTTPLTLEGADPGEFSIVSQPTSPVAPGGSTTFTVRFSPVSASAKAAIINIENNDSDENPYVLNLQGEGTLTPDPDPGPDSGPGPDPDAGPPSVPGVINVTSTASSDSYTVGSVIVFTVYFSEPVWVKGMPLLVLNTGGPVPGTADYTGGSGAEMLTFRYVVADGDDISSLDYWSEWALELNGGRIYNNLDIDADLDLAGPGEEGSIGYNTEAGVFSVMYPVYRFYSTGLSKHLFTIDEIEKAHLIENASETWRFENIAYYAYRTEQYDNGSRLQKSMLQAVHRFYSETLRTHLFTMDENEKEHLIANAADVWRYEGVAFYVPASEQEGTVPVYRFYSESLQVHLFTTDENEMNHLIQTAGDVWNFEGVAYYAFP